MYMSLSRGVWLWNILTRQCPWLCTLEHTYTSVSMASVSMDMYYGTLYTSVTMTMYYGTYLYISAYGYVLCFMPTLYYSTVFVLLTTAPWPAMYTTWLYSFFFSRLLNNICELSIGVVLYSVWTCHLIALYHVIESN